MFCPSCGKEMPDNATFCSSCGRAIQPSNQYRSQTVVPPSQPTASKVSHTGRNVGIAITVIIIIVLAFVIIGMLGANHNPLVSVNMTGVNLYIDYTSTLTSGYFGPSTQALGGSSTLSGGQQFTESLTITSNAILFTHSINSISLLTAGFTLLSVSPSPSYSLSPSSSVTFTLTIQAPNSDYNGPLGIQLSAS